MTFILNVMSSFSTLHFIAQLLKPTLYIVNAKKQLKINFNHIYLSILFKGATFFTDL